MRKAAVSLIGVLCCTAILALAHDPRTTAKDFSHGLKIEGAGDLNLSYKAMHFNVATYKRMQEDGQFRARMNSGVWSNIGAAEAGFEAGFRQGLFAAALIAGLIVVASFIAVPSVQLARSPRSASASATPGSAQA